MKIVKFEAENLKRLTVVEITPQGNLVQITGRNGSGKSSVLDAIMFAIQGASTIPSMPIRKGADKGHVRLDLGELVVTRKFTKAGSTLTVENASGLTHKTPQAVLDRLMGSIAFDPLAFSRQKPRDQFDTLRGLVELPIDLEAIEGANDRDYRERAELNKAAKTKRAQLSTWTSFAADLPEEKIDTGALVDEIAAAGKHNADIDLEERRRFDAKFAAENLLKRAEHDRKEAERMLALCAKNEAEAKAELDKLASLPGLAMSINPAEVRKKLTDANNLNKEIDRKTRYAELTAEAEAVEQQAAELTAGMTAREKQKQDAIAAAKMPIEGIGFGDGQVMLNGVPFDQASDAEQLRASCAIAMAMNPKLRVLRIRDGSLLDENGLKLLAEMADANDYQCWIEIVSDGSGKVGIVMEDGHVKAAKDAEKETVSA